MWINKNEYENMKANVTALQNRIDNLVKMVGEQKECINWLMDMHDLHKDDYYSVERGSFSVFNRALHPEPTTNFKDIDNLTFTELAEYVIDSKPITRVREHEVVVCPRTERKEDINYDGNN